MITNLKTVFNSRLKKPKTIALILIKITIIIMLKNLHQNIRNKNLKNTKNTKDSKKS